MNAFKTIVTELYGEYKEKGSKFMAYAYPVQSEQEITEKLSHLRKQFFDARHHCYAYVIGLKQQQFRANDDGEPNHSAGDPILGQIRSYGLTNTLVVVVRYFGGTKLGVGGLIHAYKTAAGEALSQAKLLDIFSETSFRIVFAYEETAAVERILAEYEITYTAKNYTEKCEFMGRLKDEQAQDLAGRWDLMEAQFELLI
jgi:uncharacterized YigZ family protein